MLGSNSKQEGEGKKKPDMKQRGDQERDRLRKRERKALLKSLTMAQMSTASVGKFDKKVNKHEPDAPTS